MEMPWQMDCTARGKGNERVEEAVVVGGWKSGRRRKKSGKRGEERSINKIGCKS